MDISTKMLCKAKRKDNGELVKGYYFCMHHNDGRKHIHHFLIPLETDLSIGTPIDKIQVEIDPDTIEKEEKLIDIDELRKELGFAEMCDNCKQDVWTCERDNYYSFKDFCARFDDAVDAILEKHKGNHSNQENPCNVCERDCYMCGVTLENDLY